MKKNYIIPATKVIDCESDELMLTVSGGDPFGEGENGTADSKYRDFNDYEEFDEEAYEEDLW